MPLFPWWERFFFSLLPGVCPLCLGKPLPTAPWCKRCYQSLPLNTHACHICGEPECKETINDTENSWISDEHTLCSHCQMNPLLIHRTFAPLLYEHEIAQLICRYKQGHDLLSGRLVFELAWQALIDANNVHDKLSDIDAILPVPSDLKRTRQRGFDPVLWLAKRLSRLLDCLMIKGRRKTSDVSQKLLNRHDRRNNMKDVFIIENPLPKRILLFDDVMTTGATLNSLATTCFEHGAEWVGAFVLARTPPKR